MPSWRRAASTTRSPAASAPVWEAAARRRPRERPALSTATGGPCGDRRRSPSKSVERLDVGQDAAAAGLPGQRRPCTSTCGDVRLVAGVDDPPEARGRARRPATRRRSPAPRSGVDETHGPGHQLGALAARTAGENELTCPVAAPDACRCSWGRPAAPRPARATRDHLVLQRGALLARLGEAARADDRHGHAGRDAVLRRRPAPRAAGTMTMARSTGPRSAGAAQRAGATAARTRARRPGRTGRMRPRHTRSAGGTRPGGGRAPRAGRWRRRPRSLRAADHQSAQRLRVIACGRHRA